MCTDTVEASGNGELTQRQSASNVGLAVVLGNWHLWFASAASSSAAPIVLHSAEHPAVHCGPTAARAISLKARANHTATNLAWLSRNEGHPDWAAERSSLRRPQPAQPLLPPQELRLRLQASDPVVRRYPPPNALISATESSTATISPDKSSDDERESPRRDIHR